jgi:predicted nucleic acid-binding protein
VEFLADTNVVSEIVKPLPDPKVIKWASDNKLDIVTSPIVLGEVRAGILFLPPGRRQNQLIEWFGRHVTQITVVVFDAQSAIVWAELIAEMKRKGRTMPIKDSLIAATARQHDLTIATRNIEDYRHAGVKLVDPFSTT